jgi:(2Fe-2S) ferredoxin
MPRPERHVLVCLNSRPPGNPKGSCAEKGSEGVFEALKARVKEKGWPIIVNRSNCLKHCSRGVTVAVYPENVWYGGVGLGDVEEICTKHLEQGNPIDRLLMPDIPWE